MFRRQSDGDAPGVRFRPRRADGVRAHRRGASRPRTRLRRRRRLLPLWRARRSGAGRTGRRGDERPHRALRARPRRHRLQHRFDAGVAAAARRPSATAVRRHGAGDQAGGGGLEVAHDQRAGDARHGGARLHPRVGARFRRRLRGDAGRLAAVWPRSQSASARRARRRRRDRARDRAVLRRAGGPPHRPGRARLHAFSAIDRPFRAPGAVAGRLRRSRAGDRSPRRCADRPRRPGGRGRPAIRGGLHQRPAAFRSAAKSLAPPRPDRYLGGERAVAD